eukprot:NODE_1529_length_947_cov_336.782851_g1066_i0.p1 GENE.NODE_1529_length_947_cov_336.782851_g1066_i0~~NODE_1529_length_947_cov_336.782851_g1066_i0.p1  ORF type:complete len:228 (-),score=17.70 NODE_1529_length_947_cov_336.782851_g1066_i0:263-880(-)
MASGITVIGLTGASRSGKSVLAARLRDHLVQRFGQDTVLRVIGLDNFYKHAVQTPEGRSEEHPDTVDHERAFQTVLTALYGRGQPVPGESNFDPTAKQRYLIVEGFISFHDRRLVALMDAKIYMRLSQEECIARRSAPRGPYNRNPQSVEYCKKILWPAHVDYVSKSVTPLGPQVKVIEADTFNPDGFLADALAHLHSLGLVPAA